MTNTHDHNDSITNDSITNDSITNDSITEATYHLCPKCLRAVPSGSHEHYCSNDGQKLLESCPGCARKITSPFARFCSGCGLGFRGSHTVKENRQ